MAEKKTTAKAPTKQDIQKELNETKTALKDAMDLIAQMKEQMAQQPQVTVVNTTEKRPNAKLKCINLYHGHLNVSTRPDGRGRVYEFKEYGQVQYIKYDDMLDIISSYPNTMASGLLYIADKDFCEEQNVYEDMDKVYTKEMLDKIAPSLLPALFTIFVFYLIKNKKWTTYKLIGLTLVLGILGSVLGILV